jgi:hypothetical protein
MKPLTNIMESVNPLYESILDRTKDKVQNSKGMVDRLRYLGGQFKFNPDRSLFRHSDMSIISVKALTRLTKGMEFKNPDTKTLMEKGFIYYSDKVEVFIKWLDNLDISEFGDVDPNNHADLEKMCGYIKKMMFDEGIFNNPETIKVRSGYSDLPKNGFYISIHKKTEFSRLLFHFDKIE